MNDIQSLTHSKWRCQYHIVFAPKYRRKEIYGKIKAGTDPRGVRACRPLEGVLRVCHRITITGSR